MQFENTETFKNLARSFAGECQAGMRYQMIAKLAMKEKLKTAIIKEIKEIGNELVIKFVDGTHRVEDLNDANVEAALAIMEKQAKERNESIGGHKA